MRSNYKQLGQYIESFDFRNKNSSEQLGLDAIKGISSIYKSFIKTKANLVGVSPGNYKVVKPNQFGFNPNTARMGDKIPIALNSGKNDVLVSSIYPTFRIIDENELLPEYLMMWFRRSEFDRYARFKSHGSAREIFDFEEMRGVELPVPSIEKQRAIVKEYNTIVKRIKLNEQLNQKLEETAQALYKHWFVDFEFPDKDGQPYKSSGGEMVYNEELDQEIPKEFSCKSIGEYSPVKSGYAFKSEWWKTEGIPVIKIGSIQNNTVGFEALGYVDDDKINTAKKYITKSGSIVIAMTGATIGKIGIIPKLSPTIMVNQRVGMFDLGQNPITKTPFLFLTLLTDYVINEIKNVGGDSAQANISSTQIEEIKILYPSAEIIIQFNRILSPAFEAYLSRIEENKFLNELTDIVLSKMSTVESQKTKMAL